jgi:RecA-family ATPase
MSDPLSVEFGDVPEAAEPNQTVLKPLNVWRPSQFRNWSEPPGSYLLLPAYLTKGELTTFIGQGGIGKSRLTFWLAICQIIGRQWCGLNTAGEPQKWLMLGDENSISRIKSDLDHMFASLTKEEQDRVEEFLLLQAVVSLEDTDVNLGDATIQARVVRTIEKTAPGVIVANPLVNFAPGDISKPGEMKEAVRLLNDTVRNSAPAAARMVLHHARTGRQNIAQGIGFDAANFASGGKTLFAAARCQMNLMPAKEEDDASLVLSCAKANNCPRFPTRGLIFDRQTHTYRVNPEFDPDEWKAEVEGRARSGQSVCSVADVVTADRVRGPERVLEDR